MNNKYSLSFITAMKPEEAILAQHIMDISWVEKNPDSHADMILPNIKPKASFLVEGLFANSKNYNILTATKPFASDWPLHYQEQQLTGFSSSVFENHTATQAISLIHTVSSPTYSGIAHLEKHLGMARLNKAKALRAWAQNDSAANWFKSLGFEPYLRDKSGKLDQRHLELKEKRFGQVLKNCSAISRKPY